MYYVCIENNAVVSILNYAPSVPNSVRVMNISDADYQLIENNTHFYDVGQLRVVENIALIAQQNRERANSVEYEFLNTTDWKILRHIRQKALNIPTSLSESEYIDLEQRREAAAGRIV